MWHFVDLTDEQKLERRHLLDLYGSVAQLSVLVPLSLLQLWFLVCWVQRKRRVGGGEDVPSSPYRKRDRVGGVRVYLRVVKTVWRRVEWWSGDRVGLMGFEAAKGEMVAAGVWTGWLLLLCMLDTKGDYMHLTKRFGIVAASQLPVHYLLSLKSPYSPLQALTHRSWESLNSIHQLLGRIITLLLYLHAIFYLNFFVQVGVLGKRLKDRDVILGLTGIISFTVIGTTSLSWVRRWNYRVFYGVHVSLATILLPVLYFHVSHIRVYIWETLAVFTLNMLLRNINQHVVDASISLMHEGTSGAGLVEVRIPVQPRRDKTVRAIMRWSPGQHVFVSTLPGSLFSRGGAVRSRNPFTVASLFEDGSLRVVARVTGANTASLADPARSGEGNVAPMMIEGPYGLPDHSLNLLRYSRVLFVAGGVGATFILPLYRQLLRDLSPGPGSRRRQNVKFVWIVREQAETRWALPHVDHDGDDDNRMAMSEAEIEGMKERMDIFVTRGSSDIADRPHPAVGRNAKSRLREEDNDEDGVEMEQLLSSSPYSSPDQQQHHQNGKEDPKEKGQGKSVYHIGRPDLGKVVDETFALTADHDKIAVFVCGPGILSRDLRREVGRWVHKREIWFWNEQFGL